MVFEHGIGGAQDLPLPLPLALAGAAAALAVSFIVLVLAWREPRFDAATQGHPLPRPLADAVDGGWLAWTLRIAGLAFAVYVGWAAYAGPDVGVNPTLGVFYVYLWVGLIPASLLFGRFYQAVNPVRTLHLLLTAVVRGRPADGAFEFPKWVGLWPAALGMFAFVWMELVFPDNSYVWAVRLWLTVYVVVVLVGALLFGDRWIAAADPFEAFSTLVAHLSCFGRTADGTLVARAPMRNLDGVAMVPGLVAVVSVLVGSTAFDSFQDSIAWVRFSQGLDLDRQLVSSVALLGFCVLVGGLFSAATRLTPSTPEVEHKTLPTRFAHSLVPIVVGYFIAHYLTFLVVFAQQTLIQLSDPMVTGADLLGTADLQVNYWLSQHQTLVATIKVTAIVGGHVLGVVAAHDRALKLLPRRHQLTGQLPLLMVMVFFTVSGLYLLLTV